MKKIIAALLVSLSLTLSACVVYPVGGVYDDQGYLVYEPDVVTNGYAVGYYNPQYGYWTGYGWDIDFYTAGHRGYGHYYRGAPRANHLNYVSGPHYHGRITYKTRVH